MLIENLNSGVAYPITDAWKIVEKVSISEKKDNLEVHTFLMLFSQAPVIEYDTSRSNGFHGLFTGDRSGKKPQIQSNPWFYMQNKQTRNSLRQTNIWVPL